MARGNNAPLAETDLHPRPMSMQNELLANYLRRAPKQSVLREKACKSPFQTEG